MGENPGPTTKGWSSVHVAVGVAGAMTEPGALEVGTKVAICNAVLDTGLTAGEAKVFKKEGTTDLPCVPVFGSEAIPNEAPPADQRLLACDCKFPAGGTGMQAPDDT